MTISQNIPLTLNFVYPKSLFKDDASLSISKPSELRRSKFFFVMTVCDGLIICTSVNIEKLEQKNY